MRPFGGPSHQPTIQTFDILARVSHTRDGSIGLEWCTEAELALDYTHIVQSIIITTNTLQPDAAGATYDDVFVTAGITRLLSLYTVWLPGHLRQLAEIHDIALPSRPNRSTVTESLLAHVCGPRCPPYVIFFTTRSELRTPERVVAPRPVPPSLRAHTEASYLQIADESLRTSIIREWQDVVSTARFQTAVCAPCGRQFFRKDLSQIHAREFDLSLLRNDAIPPQTRPTTYAFDLYHRALLEPRGMTDPWNLADLLVCATCRRELLQYQRMPRLSLANWLYYARDELPAAVADAVRRSSPFDRMLVSRARASRISFRFTEIHSRNNLNTDVRDAHNTHASAQKFLKGNILVMPQNSTHLNSVLPPPASVIRDTVCAVFVGKTKPTKATIGALSPILVRRSTVETIINFLVSHNPFYAPDGHTFFGLSEPNLRAMFGPEDVHRDLAIPCALDIGFMEDTAAIQATTSDYTHRNELGHPPSPDDPLLMENVGYTCGDDSPRSYRDMKLHALSHCLNGGSFIRSQAGETFVPDFQNPALLTWLFPHLDPWGIGGFHHPHRSQAITMEEQLSYLLQLADSPFQNDADFAFVYFNILQKKAVCDTVHFRIKATEQRRIVGQLLAVDKAVLAQLISRCKLDQNYSPQTDEESRLIALVNSVTSVLHNIPGTTGYKLHLRNEIRALVNFLGTPAFFITLNPSDIHHPLVRLFAGHNISLEDASVGEPLNDWRRRLLVAKNPGACAMFFHTMISNFISVILRYGRNQAGLFGTCTAYYGTVEAQARGTLHCHMLVWIRDHPSPQQMRDLMISDSDYQQRMFSWLESLIKSEPLGCTGVVHASSPHAARRPRHSETAGYIHPGVRPLPRVDALLPSDFNQQYKHMVNDLVEQYNWHEHTDTCWKYLRANQARSDDNCRMRINGSTRPATVLDPDSLSILLRRFHPWIANYNDLVIFLLQANMDIKHIGSGEGAKALIFYITDYITKSSVPAHLGLAALMYAINRTDAKYTGVTEWTPREDGGALTILVNSMVSRTEISQAQVMGHLIGGGDHYSSHHYRLLHYACFERLVLRHWDNTPPSISFTVDVQRIPEPMDVGVPVQPLPHPPPAPVLILPTPEGDVQMSDAEDEVVTVRFGPGSISAVNQQQDYIFRPGTEPFVSMPLYQYTGMTEKLTRTAERRRLDNHLRTDHDTAPRRGRPEQDRGEFLPPHPQHATHLVRKRTVWVVPVILGNRLPRGDRGVEERELWARTVLILFVPWRTPADLRQARETWTQAYDRLQHTITSFHRTIIHNIGVLSECRDARDKAVLDMRNGRATSVVVLDSVSNLARSRQLSDDGSGSPPPDLPDHPPGVELDSALQPPDPPRQLTSTIDSLISAAARVALDRTFRTNSPPAPVSSFGSHSQIGDTDAARIAAQHSAMRELKRRRRPSPPPPPTTTSFSAHHVQNPRPPSLNIAHVQGTTSSSGFSSNQSTVSHSGLDLSGVIRQVVLEYGLQHNPEQLRAFEIVARHVCYGGPQLLMYIAGVGGTGKSYVVNAILRLFSLLGRRQQILVSAPTGAAAILIGGYTVHSLLMLPHRDNTDLQPLVFLWAGVFYLIIDEVSMIGAPLLSDICTRLQHAKGNHDLAEDIPFGGVNIIFLGDFGQLKPVRSPALYSHRYAKNPTIQDTQRTPGVKALKGIYLWRLVKNVVILRKNQRQSGDPQYAALLARIREGHSGNARRANTADDYALLSSRLLQNFDSATMARFRDAPIIVGVKTVRDPLNERLLKHDAHKLHADVHYYHARDRVARMPPNDHDREVLWSLPSSKTGDALGKLPLFPGMRVMIQENIALAWNVVNGAIGTVRDIKYTEEDHIRYVSVLYVEIPGAGRHFGIEDNDVIPIFPVPTTFKWIKSPKTATRPAQEISVTRMQPPVLPAYVITDYKSQGRSLSTAIVDPDSALSLQGVYVMLSRVRTLEGLAILRPFRPAKTEARLSEELRIEFSRLEKLDAETRVSYNNDPLQYI